MTELVVRVEEYDRDILGTKDHDDTWSAYDQQYTFEGVYAQIKRQTDRFATHELDDVKRGDEIYIITANYDSGSSFHRSYGHTAIAGVHKTKEEARAWYESLQVNPAPEGGYVPWDGYFESLNYFEIHLVRVD